jgi:hypothetical protein
VYVRRAHRELEKCAYVLLTGQVRRQPMDPGRRLLRRLRPADMIDRAINFSWLGRCGCLDCVRAHASPPSIVGQVPCTVYVRMGRESEGWSILRTARLHDEVECKKLKLQNGYYYGMYIICLCRLGAVCCLINSTCANDAKDGKIMWYDELLKNDGNIKRV